MISRRDDVASYDAPAIVFTGRIADFEHCKRRPAKAILILALVNEASDDLTMRPLNRPSGMTPCVNAAISNANSA